MVIDEGAGLDSLLMRLEGSLTESAEGAETPVTGKESPAASPGPANGLGQTVPDFATYIDSDDASQDMLLDRLTTAERPGSNRSDQDP